MSKNIKIQLALVADICGRQLSDMAINAMAEDLKDLSEEKVIWALKKLRMSGKFPSVLEIRNFISPEINSKDEAREVVSLIFDAMAKYGWCNEEDAKEHIGEFGWKIVEREGGWKNICTLVNEDNIGTVRAQLRDLAESMHKRHAAGYGDKKPELPNNGRPPALPISGMNKLLKGVMDG